MSGRLLTENEVRRITGHTRACASHKPDWSKPWDLYHGEPQKKACTCGGNAQPIPEYAARHTA